MYKQTRFYSKKNKEHRSHVIGELLQTESEFRRGLQMAWQAFGLDTPEMLQQRSVDVETLFGNMAEVIDISEKFLETLQVRVRGTLMIFHLSLISYRLHAARGEIS